MSEHCTTHTQISEDMTVIKHDLEYIRNCVVKHIEEGDKVGGYRDRVLIVEKEVSVVKQELLRLDRALKQEVLKTGIIGGLIGAFIGQLTPELWRILLMLITR